MVTAEQLLASQDPNLVTIEHSPSTGGVWHVVVRPGSLRKNLCPATILKSVRGVVHLYAEEWLLARDILGSVEFHGGPDDAIQALRDGGYPVTDAR